MTAIDRLAAEIDRGKLVDGETPARIATFVQEDVVAVLKIAQVSADLIAAIDAFRAFENENPNDSTKRWDAVFEAKCEAEDALRHALAEASK